MIDCYMTVHLSIDDMGEGPYIRCEFRDSKHPGWVALASQKDNPIGFENLKTMIADRQRDANRQQAERDGIFI